MRKLYLHIISCLLIISFSSYSQTDTHPSISNSYGVVDNTISNEMFYGRDGTASCCGNVDASNIVV